MTSHLLHRSAMLGARTPLFALGLGVATCMLAPSMFLCSSRPLYRLEASTSPRITPSLSHSRATHQGRQLDRRVIRQLSAGSIFGFGSGLIISVFSKSLTLLFGLLFIGVQTAESYGVRIVPYKRLQKYFNNVDISRLVHENVAFKLSFGLMFALSAFASF